MDTHLQYMLYFRSTKSTLLEALYNICHIHNLMAEANLKKPK